MGLLYQTKENFSLSRKQNRTLNRNIIIYKKRLSKCTLANQCYILTITRPYIELTIFGILFILIFDEMISFSRDVSFFFSCFSHISMFSIHSVKKHKSSNILFVYRIHTFTQLHRNRCIAMFTTMASPPAGRTENIARHRTFFVYEIQMNF